MPAAFDNHYVTRINGTNVKRERRSAIWPSRFDRTSATSSRAKVDRVVMVWCASTEIYIKAGAAHATLEQFEKAMERNDETIAPSMLYAYAALMEGVPFANGAPNLTVDMPCLIQLAKERGVPISGKDFKTGQTWMKTVIAPGTQGAHARLAGWYSTNILGKP